MGNVTQSMAGVAPAGGRTRRQVGKAVVISAFAVFVMLLGQAPALASPDAVSLGDVAPVPSVGCESEPVAAGTSAHLFSAAGRSGDYLQTVPQLADRTPAPVVFDVHGYLQPGIMQAAWSRMAEHGARNGFVVITPETRAFPPKWEYGQGGADIAFLSALLTHVEKTLCIDKRRVYMTGLSMGGFTTSSVACQLADRFAAVAPVAGLQNFAWCNPSRPVPVVSFHGTSDEILSYTGGVGPRGMLLPAPDGSPRTLGQQLQDGVHPEKLPNPHSIPTQTAAWAGRNGCAPTPSVSVVAPEVTRTSYTCPAGSDVELYTVPGGHNWPGGDPTLAVTPITGPITTSVDATAIIWDFFREHPLAGSVR